jgi:NADH-quinone oxidoreductase subunit M
MKRVLAYSSFSHLGFCVLGLMAMNRIGLQGSILYMINHGISTGALFLCVGMLYDRYKTTDQYDMSGLSRIMPRLAFFIVLFAMSSIGLPGLNGFVSEFLTILGAFTSSAHLGTRFGVLAALGVILSAVYLLHMVGQILFGPLKTPAPQPAAKKISRDLDGREMAILTPLAILVVLLGVMPTQLILDPISVQVDGILKMTDKEPQVMAAKMVETPVVAIAK